MRAKFASQDATLLQADAERACDRERTYTQRNAGVAAERSYTQRTAEIEARDLCGEVISHDSDIDPLRLGHAEPPFEPTG